MRAARDPQKPAQKHKEQGQKIEKEFHADKSRLLSVAGKILGHAGLPRALERFFSGHETSIATLAAGTGPIDLVRVTTRLATAFVSLRDRLAGKKGPYDRSQPPFLLRLLRDPDILDFFVRTPKLAALLDDQKITSLIVPYVFKILSKSPLIKALEAQGLGSAYINEHLRPALIAAMKTFLTNPEMLLKVAGLVLEMQLHTDPKEKARLLAQIVESLDAAKIIEALQPLGPVLIAQGRQIASLVATALPDLLKQLPAGVTVSPQLVQGAAAVLLPTAGAALAHADALASIAAQLKAIILDDTSARIKAATSLKEITALDAESSKRKMELVKSILALVAQPNVLKALATKAPEFLAAHGKELNEAIAKLLPQVVAKLVADSQALADDCQPGLDRAAIAEIVTPLPILALQPLGQSFYADILPPVVSIVTAALAHSEIVPQAQAALTNPGDIASLAALFRTAEKILSDPKTQTALTATLPAVISAHADAIGRSISAALTTSKLPTFITPALVRDLMPVTLAAFPAMYNLAAGCLQDPQNLAAVVQGGQSIIAAPDGARGKMMPALLDNIFHLTENPAVKTVIETELPQILEAHSDALGKVIDGFIKNTDIGKDLNVQTGMLIAIAAKKVPQLVAVARAYSERKYGTMIADAVKIVFSDRRILSEVGRIALTVLAHKARNFVHPKHQPRSGPQASTTRSAH